VTGVGRLEEALLNRIIELRIADRAIGAHGRQLLVVLHAPAVAEAGVLDDEGLLLALVLSADLVAADQLERIDLAGVQLVLELIHRELDLVLQRVAASDHDHDRDQDENEQRIRAEGLGLLGLVLVVFVLRFAHGVSIGEERLEREGGMPAPDRFQPTPRALA